MTCVVGLEKNGKVWVGGDSASSTDVLIEQQVHPKVFKRGKFLFGYASDFRAAQAIEHAFTPPVHKHGISPVAYLATAFVNAMRKTLREAGALTYGDNVEKFDACFLIGYLGHLYFVDGGFAVLTFGSEYTAIGDGAPYALGALHATPTKPPGLRVRSALEAAAQHCPSVRAPFHVLSL